jgi:hypothetical protein
MSAWMARALTHVENPAQASVAGNPEIAMGKLSRWGSVSPLAQVCPWPQG